MVTLRTGTNKVFASASDVKNLNSLFFHIFCRVKHVCSKTQTDFIVDIIDLGNLLTSLQRPLEKEAELQNWHVVDKTLVCKHSDPGCAGGGGGTVMGELVVVSGRGVPIERDGGQGWPVQHYGFVGLPIVIVFS